MLVPDIILTLRPAPAWVYLHLLAHDCQAHSLKELQHWCGFSHPTLRICLCVLRTRGLISTIIHSGDKIGVRHSVHLIPIEEIPCAQAVFPPTSG